MQEAHLDFETASPTDLLKSGVYRYAEDPNTRVWGFSYAFGDNGTPKQWRPGYPDPEELLAHVRAGGMIVIHNASFERTIWNWVVVGRLCPHWPQMLISQQDCTMSRAAAIAHPQGLDNLGIALGTNMRKDPEGHKLMMKMARPRRYNEDGSITWWDEPENQDNLMLYCDQDVRTESEGHSRLPPLSPTWRQVWEFDQIINDRGIGIDHHAVERCAQLVEYSKKQNDKVMRDLTDRAVPKCTNDKKIIDWLNGRGVECDSIAKGVVDDVLFMANCRNDQTAQDVIRLRQAAWKTSTAKYRSMQKCVNADHRIRGTLNFHGASTGRWAGRLIQPQNFPRTDPDDKVLEGEIAWLHEMLNDDTMTPRDIYDCIATVWGPLEPMNLLSKALRSMFVAGPGKKFVSGDFSNIEGRVNVWLANEPWKMQAFRDYDEGTGPDLYKMAYAKSFNVPVEDIGKGHERQIGKVQELSLGYQGSIGAYLQMGANYGVDPFALSKPVYDATSAEQWDATAFLYSGAVSAGNTYGLFEKEWTALKVLVDNWRAAHPNVVKSWWAYQDAAIEAVSAPGNVIPVAAGRVSYYSDGRCLWCVLPSGRMICYSAPEIVEEIYRYKDKKTGETKSTTRRKVTFMGTDSKTKRWKKQSLYGGLQCENIVQAASVDLLVEAMFRGEHAGYPVVLTVHDEIVSEVDEFSNELNYRNFEQIMSVVPTWAKGLPLSVSAWEDKRYVK